MNLEQFFSHPYVNAVFILLLFLILARASYYILKKYVEQFVRKRKTLFDELVIKKLETPVIIIFILMGFKYGALPLDLEGLVYDSIIDSLIIAVITHTAIIVVDRLIDIWKYRWKVTTDATFEDEIVNLLHGFSKFFLFAIGLTIILSEWGVKVGAVFTSLGIAGIVLGFAVQDSLKNIFGGVSIVMDKAFRLHDVIQLESGEMGEVVSIGMRSTRIVTYDEQELIIPNSVIADTKIINLARPKKQIRLAIDVAVAYGSDTDKVYRVLRKCLKEEKTVLDDPKPYIRFDKMAEYSLNFKVYFFIRDYKRMWSIKDSMTNKIYKRLNKEKIRIPFPTRTLYMRKS